MVATTGCDGVGSVVGAWAALGYLGSYRQLPCRIRVASQLRHGVQLGRAGPLSLTSSTTRPHSPLTLKGLVVAKAHPER
jgi:hypothetical protein